MARLAAIVFICGLSSRGLAQEAITPTTGEVVGVQRNGVTAYRNAMRAARRTSSVVIDGRADETSWQAAPEVRAEWKLAPEEAGNVVAPTYVRTLFDDDAIYFFFRLPDPDPAQIRGLLERRGDNWDRMAQSDWISVMLDPTHSRKYGYSFNVNPRGVQGDWRIVEQTDHTDVDPTYDAVWEAATSRDAEGWNVECRIPYSQLRVRGGFQDRWGVQFVRRWARNTDFVLWSPMPHDASGGPGGRWFAFLGDLVIQDDIGTRRNIELMPYALLGIGIAHRESGNAYDGSKEAQYSFGGDAKVEISDSLALTAAINPDFGQIEADPAQVNLTTREIFFAEKRPLFLKDSELFRLELGRSQQESLFYSRRIGAPPHFSQAGTGPFDEPRTTTILGAAKLTGSLGGTNVGLLSALGERESSVATLDTGEMVEATIEPMTLYNVGQAGRVFRDGRSDLRVQLTSVNRKHEAATSQLVNQAYSAGVHYEHRFEDNWATLTKVAGSYVAGDPAALVRLQTASQRYFQRPDAEHVELDPDRTRLAGGAVMASVNKIAGGSWRGSAGLDARTPGFETNDLGFLLDADLLAPWVETKYVDNEPGDLFKNWDATLGVQGNASFEPEWRNTVARLGWAGKRTNDDETWGSVWGTKESLDTALLRGGPAVSGVDAVGGTLSYKTDPKRRVWLIGSAFTEVRPEAHSWVVNGNIAAAFNVLPNLELQLGPSVTRARNDYQFVTTATDSAMMPRYVLGSLRVSELSTIVRLNYTITPRLSLQLYLQPFISSGKFASFKEMTDPKANAYADRFTPLAATENADGSLAVDSDGDGMPDYSFRSGSYKTTFYRQNVVFRWEFLRGSTLYLIWSQSRNGSRPIGRITADDAGSIPTANGEQVFLLKASYWWST